MIVGMAVLVTVCSIDASTMTSISAAVTHRRSNRGRVFLAAAICTGDGGTMSTDAVGFTASPSPAASPSGRATIFPSAGSKHS